MRKTLLSLLLILGLVGGAQAAEISDLSTTDASNIARFPENMAPSAVNNGARALEGLLARGLKDTIDSNLTSAGTANAQTVSANRAISAYSAGLTITFKAGAGLTNTGSTTLNVDAAAAHTIKKPDGRALAAGDITAGGYYTVVHDGTSTWYLVSASRPVETVQKFTASGTWTKPSGVKSVWVRMVGGGGAGGGSAATSANNAAAGGGGGAGEYAEALLDVSAIASSTITIGAAGAAALGAVGGNGGNTSWADGTNTVSANGGTGGALGTDASGNSFNAGGLGGTGGSGGDFQAIGAPGQAGITSFATTSAQQHATGLGGSSPFGGGGRGQNNNTGEAATGKGAGGGGASATAGQSARSGGAGTAGYIIVYEYY